MPKGELYRDSALAIEDLGEEFGFSPFEPHVTFLEELYSDEREIVTKSEGLARSCKPFEICVGPVKYSEELFKSIYVEVENSKPLQDLHKAAAKAYGLSGNSKYLPHLTLMIGKKPFSEKQAAMERIGKNFSGTFKADTLYAVRMDKKQMEAVRREASIVKEISFGKR